MRTVTLRMWLLAEKVDTATVTYVCNVYKYYLGWKLISEREAIRAQVKKSAAGP